MKFLKGNKLSKKWVVPLIHWTGMKSLEKAALTPSWKTVWSAGQSVGLVHDIKTCEQIMVDFFNEYQSVVTALKAGVKNEI